MTEPAPVNLIKHRCTRCGKDARHKCGNCTFHYCSRDCQRTDWPEHKAKCRPMPTREQALAGITMGGADVNKQYNIPLIKNKPCLFLPKPSGTLPPIMRDLDDPAVRKALEITDEQYAATGPGLVVVRTDEYYEAMRQLSPWQQMEVVIDAHTKAHSISTVSDAEKKS